MGHSYKGQQIADKKTTTSTHFRNHVFFPSYSMNLWKLHGKPEENPRCFLPMVTFFCITRWKKLLRGQLFSYQPGRKTLFSKFKYTVMNMKCLQVHCKIYSNRNVHIHIYIYIYLYIYIRICIYELRIYIYICVYIYIIVYIDTHIKHVYTLSIIIYAQVCLKTGYS